MSIETQTEEAVQLSPMYLSTTNQEKSMVSEWETSLYTTSHESCSQVNGRNYIILPPFGNDYLQVCTNLETN